MMASVNGNEVSYSSRRVGADAEFRARYGPVKPAEPRARGSLEHWLTERYCLYTVAHGRVYRAEIHHVQWPLQDADGQIEKNSMTEAAGIPLPRAAPLLHFARCLEVLIWPVKRVG
jgi:uncharacterized protein YqjF (DUF2071 family)